MFAQFLCSLSSSILCFFVFFSFIPFHCTTRCSNPQNALFCEKKSNFFSFPSRSNFLIYFGSEERTSVYSDNNVKQVTVIISCCLAQWDIIALSLLCREIFTTMYHVSKLMDWVRKHNNIFLTLDFTQGIRIFQINLHFVFQGNIYHCMFTVINFLSFLSKCTLQEI